MAYYATMELCFTINTVCMPQVRSDEGQLQSQQQAAAQTVMPLVPAWQAQQNFCSAQWSLCWAFTKDHTPCLIQHPESPLCHLEKPEKVLAC